MGNFVGFKNKFRWKKLSVRPVQFLMSGGLYYEANITLRADDIMVFITFHKSYLL